MSQLSDLLERVTTRLEGASALDRPADAAQAVTKRLGPGAVKDALSGTPIGHPLHPLLAAVPIGAFTCAAVLDLGREDRAARRLIALGVLSSLPTAAAGLSDWSETGGAERRVGLVHSVTNTVALALYSASWLARRRAGRGRWTAAAGLGTLAASGWLGGHLAYALGVGVDTTAFTNPPADWTDAGPESDLADGEPHAVRIGDESIMLIRRDGRVLAMANRCTHRGAPLDEGPVVDGCIECPWHGSRFRLTDGLVERGPATRPQPVLEVRVASGRVQVRRTENRALRTNPV